MTIDLFCTQYISEGLLGATDMESAAVTKDVSITPDSNNDSSPEEQRKQVKRPLPKVNNDDIKKGVATLRRHVLLPARLRCRQV